MKTCHPGSRIGREHYTPPIERYSDRFRVFYLGFFGVVERPEDLLAMDYMIVSSLDYGRFLGDQTAYPRESQAYLQFFDQHLLVKEFVPDGETVGGPRVSIFRIRRDEFR